MFKEADRAIAEGVLLILSDRKMDGKKAPIPCSSGRKCLASIFGPYRKSHKGEYDR